MNILLVSDDLIAGNLAFLLQKEGHNVKLYIESKQQRLNFHNIVPKTKNWQKELKWVGKDGLIIFDYIGYGKVQDQLRKEGYSVFGGCELGDRLEEDRQWSQEIFKKYGLDTLPTINFTSLQSAISFLKENSGPWVIKQNGQASKHVNYVGHFADNRDVISILENYIRNHGNKLGNITLQKRVYGVEIGVGRYFNGTDWVGPIEINIEHKKLFPGDIGPTTSEMGTIAWYDDDEKNKLFQKTLAKLKPFLKEIDFRGDIDIGCMANGDGVFTLEATPRIGSPIIHLHSEIHTSPWGKFLKSIADNKNFNLKWKKGVGIVVLVSLPPFPYTKKLQGNSSFGVEVFFESTLKKEDFRHIHFEEISKREKDGLTQYYISDHRGYILYVTAMGKTVEKARSAAQKILDKIYIPKMFYRNDIGLKFFKEDKFKLKKWGYLNTIDIK
jgi:phosphoribosylamine--glycine ligase